MANEPFVVEGDLWLLCQEGGFVYDAFSLADELTADGYFLYGIDLAEMVSEHFGEKRIPRGDGEWHRHVGMVRVTIERLERADDGG